jgi:hypothetical protein
MFDEGYCAGKQNHNRRSTRHNALMSVRLLPLFEVDIPVLILLLLFDLSFRWLVHLLDIRRVVLLTRVIERRFARIFLMRLSAVESILRVCNVVPTLRHTLKPPAGWTVGIFG